MKHKVIFVTSAEVDLSSTHPSDSEKVQAIVDLFRRHATIIEGQLDLLSLPHTVKITFFDSENESSNIGF